MIQSVIQGWKINYFKAEIKENLLYGWNVFAISALDLTIHKTSKDLSNSAGKF